MKNASEDDYVYTGSVLDFSPQAVLYCVVDGERYEFNIQHYYMMVVDASDDESSYSVKSTEMQISAFPPNIYKASDMEKIERTVKSGEEARRSFKCVLPADAPSGSYNLKLSYKNSERIFENVFTLE